MEHIGKENLQEMKKQFDPDLPPDHPNNKEAAKERDYHYDSAKGFYVDVSGCLVLDRFGQPL